MRASAAGIQIHSCIWI